MDISAKHCQGLNWVIDNLIMCHFFVPELRCNDKTDSIEEILGTVLVKNTERGESRYSPNLLRGTLH